MCSECTGDCWRNGVEGLVPVDISEEERTELLKSAEVLKANIASVGDQFA
jgi:malate/lactate dehydrogenase